MFRSPDNLVTSTCITLTPELRAAAKLRATVLAEGQERKGYEQVAAWQKDVREADALLKSSIQEATLVE